MKKFLALFLTLVLLAGLTACKAADAADPAQEQNTVTAPTNDATFVYQPDDPTLIPAGGQTIALVTGPSGTENGADAMLWQGVQTFANTYGYTADTYAAAGNTADDAETALRAAAESGARLVVCQGEAAGEALYRIQDNYPDVHYLLFDDEPHNADYSAYKTAELVHCVLFQEEQAGYLAGYAVVTEGYTALGFIGTREVPGIVRYATGFLQGAEYAAEQQGLTVDLRTWFAGTYSASDDTTNRMLDWCNNGTTLLFVNGGNLIASAIDAAKETTSGNEVRVMASDYDQNDSSDLILGSAIKCYNSAVQQELYAFFSGNAAWDQTAAGQSEKVGYTTGAVALAGPHWRFAELSQHDYERLYTQLRNSDLKVDAYADMNTLPDTPNVTVEEQN